MCSAAPPALSCPPASWVWRAAARIRGGGGGEAGRKGGRRGGKGGGDEVERKGGAAAAAGSPDCVSSPTRMSSSGEEDQAVHGSSAPPAAAAQTVAVPHTGLGNCRLRRAQCACAAPAVAVPPVLMLRLLLKMLPRRQEPRRGLSISPSAPRPSSGKGRGGTLLLSPHPEPKPRPPSLSLLPQSLSPSFSRSCFTAAQGSLTSAGLCERLVAAPFSTKIQTSARWLVWAVVGRGKQCRREKGVTSQLLPPPSQTPATPGAAGPGAEVQEGSCSSPGSAPSRK